jgi:hypothetical protein
MVAVLAVFFTLAMVIACGGANHSNGPDAAQVPKDPDASNDHNGIQVSATTLGKELKADAAATEKKYDGKTLIVDGTVTLISNNIVALETDEGGVSVQLFLNSKSIPATIKVESGYAVKVRGRATFVGTHRLDLVDCTILDSKLSQAPPMPAAKLTEEFVKNKDAANGKYFLRTIIVEGVVAEVVFHPETKSRYILLAGHNETDTKPLRVHAAFTEEQDEILKTIKKGQTVRVRGQCRGEGFDEIVVGDSVFMP